METNWIGRRSVFTAFDVPTTTDFDKHVFLIFFSQWRKEKANLIQAIEEKLPFFYYVIASFR